MNKNFNLTNITKTLNRVLKYKEVRICNFGSNYSKNEYLRLFSGFYELKGLDYGLINYEPEQANTLIVWGPVNFKNITNLISVYERIPKPCWVIGCGIQSSNDKLFPSYWTISDVSKSIPIDLFIGGDKPRPEAIIEAINSVTIMMNEKMKKVSSTND